MLTAITKGMENKISSFKQIIAAMYVQRCWRRYVARKKYA